MARCNAMAGLLVACAILAIATSVSGQVEYNPLVPYTATYKTIINGVEEEVKTITQNSFPFPFTTALTTSTGNTVPKGTYVFRVQYTVDTSASIKQANGVRCLTTTDSNLITTKQINAIFYSLTTSPCYSCSDNNPKVQTINGFTAYSPLKCLATGSALGTVGEYTVIQTKGAAMGSRIDLGTAWMTVEVDTYGVAKQLPFALCLLDFPGQVGKAWVPVLP